MRLGVMAFTGADLVPFHDLAVEAERLGVDTIYAPEHSHIPVSRESPFPAGGDLPDFYYGFLDPFVALASAATVTDTIRLGTAVTLVPQHDAINLAKTIASLDVVSGGRTVVGVGFGWNVEELENHRPGKARSRWSLGREVVLAMQELWANEVAEFSGKHVSFAPSNQWPKPVQSPRPPIMLGGAPTDANFARIAEFGDAWFPLFGGRRLADDIARLRATAEASGRNPGQIEVVCGTPVLDASILERYAEVGVDEVVLALPVDGRDSVMSTLDQFATLGAQYRR